MKCRYTVIATTKRAGTRPVVECEHAALLPAVAIQVSPGHEILQRDLLEHYLQHTSGTFGALSTRSQRFWRTVVPALAYTSQAVRLGMLTMAALCQSNDMNATDPEHSKDYLRAAERYGQEFVRRSSQSAQSLRQREAGVHLTCSRLLTILALAWFRIDRLHRGVRLTDPEAWVWLHMLRGSALLHNRYDTNGSSSITESLANELDLDASNAGTPTVDTFCSYECEPAFQLLRSSRKARFAALRDAALLRCPPQGFQATGYLLFAIQCLEDTTEKLCCDNEASLIRTLLFWPASVSREFVDLLESGDALALAIYAHWLMAMALVKDAWFVEGMSYAGIREIAAMNDVSGDDIANGMLLYWPLQMLNEISKPRQ